MDLLVGAKKVIVTTSHLTKDGKSKLMKTCTFPLTSTRSVDLIITELAVFTVMNEQLVLTELMPGATLEQVRESTESDFDEGGICS
jgi:3-oxoacid CoA-transferase